jgi:hypothetical protein
MTALTDTLFPIFLHWLKRNDGRLPDCEWQAMSALADDEARARGYENWIEACHTCSGPDEAMDREDAAA